MVSVICAARFDTIPFNVVTVIVEGWRQIYPTAVIDLLGAYSAVVEHPKRRRTHRLSRARAWTWVPDCHKG